MSHRVTFRSEIRDRELAIQALEASKISYQFATDDQNRILLLSGHLRGASINLKTGEVESDTDIHNRDELGSLRQAYSEAEFRRESARKGATVENRSVVTHNGVQGVVKLSCYASVMSA